MTIKKYAKLGQPDWFLVASNITVNISLVTDNPSMPRADAAIRKKICAIYGKHIKWQNFVISKKEERCWRYDIGHYKQYAFRAIATITGEGKV